MIYTVEDCGMQQTFEGFCKYVDDENSYKRKILGVIKHENRIDLWWIDEYDLSLGLEELERYYRMLFKIDDIEIKTFKPC